MSESSDYCGFFEGTEKLLEVWFGNENDHYHNDCDLRKIPRSAWESILKLVKCEIISFKKNDAIDAYVLSESSMFVSKNRFILKTCGSTTLLRCIEPLLYVAKEIAGFDEVLDVYYSRKNFMRPQLQEKPHTAFEDEVEVLESYFEDGAAYCMGRVNRDCWYLFTLNPLTPAKVIEIPDQTLEVIMQNLDPKVMKIFTREACSTAKEATTKSGIDKIFPNVTIDDFLFKPCGYSMNGIMKGGYYMTIHVTPEPHCSYVSFETNFPQNSYHDVVMRLLRIFKPGKFIMTLFANENSVASESLQEYRNVKFHGYSKKELQICHLKNYDMTYGLFAKAPS
ncbi:S-adenosylmethionine decarboxylase proenzyme-like protein [Dinothrombium tinctorium]|uniref:S-adenosylmethionine decarboxylase proenzyme n=1 Tax=Dinothrombium tinctorium TaxID=1965070 RepID=A0A3S3NYR9_9ACAR|nr:S-adenosylmethionine decarboxylase proenzyme-like protein [Dinothrombium tinctorium]RWS04569.1 S-adenosylmethionine decarboxylase proenzyme-like protein [Dinothrombium tinctorium]RWS04761.1 S-adenosylmethionine decarboxylase proenzyme-like protein [Dinothrombium tinctorium]